MLADGASHLFVQLSQSVEVQETRTGNRVTYLLKGARVLHHNNENSLVTTFFNTPVERARLLPAKGGLDFVIDLRASVTPTWKISPAKDNSAIFEVVLPKGDYLKGAAQPSDDSEMAGQGSPNAAPSPPPAAATTPMGGRRHRRLGGGGAGAGGGGGAGGSTGGSGPPAQ